MYTLYHTTQTCTCCSRSESWSTICVTEPHGTGTKSVPAHTIPDGASIATVHIAARPIPVCAACLPADASSRGEAARIAFEEARRRKARESTHSPTPAQPAAKRFATLDELA